MSTIRTRAAHAGRFSLVLAVAGVLCLLAYGVGWAEQRVEKDPERRAQSTERTERVGQRAGQRAPGRAGRGAGTGDNAGERSVRPTAPAGPADEQADDQPDGQAYGERDEPRSPSTPAVPAPGRTLLGVGDSGAQVRALQARLAQIDWFDHQVTGYYGDVTAAAVEGFQAKRGFTATGAVDRRTLRRLEEMTTEPTPAELDGSASTNVPGRLDERCRAGRVLCIDKTSRTLRWVVDGQVLSTVDVRFGSDYTPTREGRFSVFSKSRDHVSSLYDTPMPYAMFFSGGQAVHYSADFAAVGYGGASHGCVNVRDRDAVARLFDQVRVGDAVVVYWS